MVCQFILFAQETEGSYCCGVVFECLEEDHEILEVLGIGYIL